MRLADHSMQGAGPLQIGHAFRPQHRTGLPAFGPFRAPRSPGLEIGQRPDGPGGSPSRAAERPDRIVEKSIRWPWAQSKSGRLGGTEQHGLRGGPHPGEA